MKTPIHLLMVSFWKSEYVEKIEMCIMKLIDSERLIMGARIVVDVYNVLL